MNVMIFNESMWKSGEIDLHTVAVCNFVILVDANEFYYIKNRAVGTTMKRHPITELPRHIDLIQTIYRERSEIDKAMGEFCELTRDENA